MIIIWKKGGVSRISVEQYIAYIDKHRDHIEDIIVGEGLE